MKIVTAEEMRAIDRATTEKYGVPSLTLMENAGTAVAEFAQKHFDFDSVCAVCGKGNNGGDGFVAARKLHEAGKKVSVIVLAKGPEELRGDAAEMFKKLPVPALWVADEKDFSKPEVEQALKSDLILDAILGTGFKPPLKGIAEKAIIRINKAQALCWPWISHPGSMQTWKNRRKALLAFTQTPLSPSPLPNLPWYSAISRMAPSR